MPDIGDAILQITDRRGRPLGALVRSEEALEIEELGLGRYRLVSRRMALPVWVEPGWLAPRQVRVLLDGGEHVYVATPTRAVDVGLVCDTEGCPEQLACDLNPCQPLGEGAHACECPEGDATLSILDAGESLPLERVPADIDALTIDLREESFVRGRWTGPLPCRAVAHYPAQLEIPAAEVRCDADGTFFLSELRPGPATITVSHGEALASIPVDLQHGSEVWLGDVAPSTVEVSGWIEADFSLLDARLTASPHGAALLASDGWFAVRGLPPDADQLHLHLSSHSYGQFKTWVYFGDDPGAELRWTIHLDEGLDAVPVDDTGAPEVLMDDTGASGDDTGRAAPDPDTGDSGGY